MIEGPIQTNNSGLVFYFDTKEPKSYVGEPTTNIIPSPSINAIPTYGNGWGTYNTNQYNNAQYFSIGTISSVSNNIVTTSGNHPLRTYDVVQPQTSGGGLTGGQVYFIKKLSNTTFTIHAYNGSQDGSQGYINPSTRTHKVWDDIANDVRVSINSTNFPTMWWGPPHVPNSGLVKEIIPNGFNAIYGKVTDCIRLHYNRTDGVTDGMSYNVDCTVTPNTTYTVSFWSRSVDTNAVGKQIQYQNYNYTGGSAAGFYGYFTLGPIGVWQKQSFTFTYTYGTVISYWFANGSPPFKWDLANIQVEQKDHSTAFVAGSRSNAQGLLDLTGNYIIDLTNAAYDSSSKIYLSGSKAIKINSNSSLFSNAFTWSAWHYIIADGGTGYAGIFWAEGAVAGGSGYQYLLSYRNLGSNAYAHYRINNATTGWGNTDTGTLMSSMLNKWIYTTWTFNNGTTKIYINGVLSHTDTSRGAYNGGSDSPIYIGARNDLWGSINGYIDLVSYHNRTLTDAEILKNFNSQRSRYSV